MRSTATIHRDVFRAAPEGVWSAPGRVNLIGEHTDYNQGLVLPIALPQRTSVACAPRTDDLVRVHSVHAKESVEVPLESVGPGSPQGWAAYAVGVLWALRAEGHPVSGMDITISSQVPVGAGLSSSAALECAVGAAASDLFGLGLMAEESSRSRLAAACVRAENIVAGAATGGMDQAAALLCRPDMALFLDCRDGSTDHMPFNLMGSDLVLLVTDTRAEHALNDGQYANRRRACERAAADLGVASLRDIPAAELEDSLGWLSEHELRRRTRHVVTEIARVRSTVAALLDDDFTDVGRLFLESHASLRDDYEVSCPELDVSVEAACDGGAIGARMTGGGFGGSSIALVSRFDVEAAAESVREAFLDRGWAQPHSFIVAAEGAAGRDE